MRRWLVSALLLLPMLVAASETITLRYPTVKSADENAVVFYGSAYLQALFKDSRFELIPVHIPPNFRLVAELSEDKIDLLLIPVSPDMQGVFTEGLMDYYPEVFFTSSVNLFGLAGNETNWEGFSMTQLPNYHVGIPTGIPDQIIQIYLNHNPLGQVSRFYNKHQMVKALVTRRVDLVLSERIGIDQAALRLGVTDRIEAVATLKHVEAKIVIRASIHQRIREALESYLAQRLQDFDRGATFQSILQEYHH